MLLWGYLNIAAAIAVALGLWLNIDVKVMGFFLICDSSSIF